MKKILFLSISAIIFFSVGCVGPRTAHIGRHYLMATNLTGTVTSQQVGNQPPVVYGQTNFSVTAIPPVARTWRERVTGKRPPGATSPLVVPPMPNAGITGLTPMAIGGGGGGAHQGALRRVVSQNGGYSSPPQGQRYRLNAHGGRVLLPSRGY
ncbi:MAG: hypothetical protein Q7R64_00715 [bacterium]|nr:hypothetical protein [bacterium]